METSRAPLKKRQKKSASCKKSKDIPTKDSMTSASNTSKKSRHSSSSSKRTNSIKEQEKPSQVKERLAPDIDSLNFGKTLQYSEYFDDTVPKKDKALSKRTSTTGHLSRTAASNGQKSAYRSYQSRIEEPALSPRQEFLTKEIERLHEEQKLQMEEDQGVASAKRAKTGEKGATRTSDGMEDKPKEDSRSPEHSKTVLPSYTTFSRVFRKFGFKDTVKSELDTHQENILSLTTLLTCFAILSVIVIVIVLFVINALFRDEDITIECNSKECIRLRDEMVDLLNHSVHPCDDFYTHVCSHWINNGGGFIEDAVAKFRKAIFNFPSHSQPDRHGMHIMSHLYRTCTEFVSGKDVSWTDTISYAYGFLNLADILNAGNIAQLVNQLVNISLRNDIHTTFMFKFTKKGERIYLFLSVGKVIRTKLQDVVTDVFPSDVNSPLNFDDVKAYVSEVVDILCTSPDKRGTYCDQTTKDVQSVTDLDRVFQFLAPDAYEPAEYKAFRDISVVSNTSNVDVLGIINNMIPPHRHLTRESTIIIRGSTPLEAVRDNMMQYDLRVTALYYTAHVLADILQYTQVQRYVRVPYATSMVCARVTQHALVHTWPYLVARQADYGSPTSSQKLIESMVNLTISGDILLWLENYSRDEIARGLKKLRFQMYDTSVLEENHLGVDYSSLSLKTLPFVPAYLKTKAFESVLLHEHVPSEGSIPLAEHQFRANMSQLKSFSWLLVPTFFQGPPLFFFKKNDLVPVYFNFATFGVLGAKEIVRYMRPIQSWDTITKARVGHAVLCFRKIRRTLGLDEAEESFAWDDVAMDWSLGSRSAYDTMEISLRREGSKAFNLNWAMAQYIFFIRSCMLACASSVHASERPLVQREICLLPVLANENFYTYFNCSESHKLKMDPCVSTIFKKV
ncbi:uncharacterized protein LOC135383912 [Ornithodoros turicata]|uniref:uncharacterized protein LOC135383912 n=1 Tax=Ornithodoros turicata TaxID=34597 RepID=UPI0031397078